MRSLLCQRGLSTSGRGLQPSAQRPHPRQVVLRAKSSSGVEQQWDKFVRDTQPKVTEWVEDVKASAQRTYVRIDSEYDLTGKAAKAAKRVQETAKDVDQQYGVMRRLRSWALQLQKEWPIWSRKFEDFAATTPGKVVIVSGLFLLMTTPVFWRILNAVLLLWWLGLPLALILVANAQQAQIRAAQQAAAEEAERRRNPFASIFRGRGSGAGASRSGAATSRPSSSSYTGPIIEAEWRPVDDDKK